MLPNQKIKVKWNPTTKYHYENFGYKYTKMHDEFMVDINELTNQSNMKVKIICDYCGEEYFRSYDYYNKKRQNLIVNKDFCSNCKSTYTQEVLDTKLEVRICIVNNCESKQKSSIGYCYKHYSIFKRYGYIPQDIKSPNKNRTKESSINEILNFFKENGKFSTWQLLKKGKGVYSYIIKYHGNLREFCEDNNIGYVLVDSHINWNDENAVQTLIKIYKENQNKINSRILRENNLMYLYTWFKKEKGGLKQFCIDHNLEYMVKSMKEMWNDEKCIAIIKSYYDKENIKVSYGYLKNKNKGVHGYIYDNYGNFKTFIDKYNLEEYVDIKNSMSTGEIDISRQLDKYNIKYEYDIPIKKWKRKYPLPFDFITEDLVIEFDGSQHFYAFTAWGGEKKFKQRVKNDISKNEYCIKNKIFLVRIPFWEQKNLEYILNQVLGYFNLIEKHDIDENLVHKYLVNHPNWSHEEYIKQAK